MVEEWPLLVLDRFLERANILGFKNFDRKDVAGIFAKDQTVELEGAWHGNV